MDNFQKTSPKTNSKSDLPQNVHGILLVNKPKGKTSFSLVARLRKIFGVRKIGHTGTLDPFATGVMVMLIGRHFTRLSENFLIKEKEYLAKIYLGATTDTFDSEGKILSRSDMIPTSTEIDEAIKHLQGTIKQVPPMYSAKKVEGKKLYELARQGKTVERKAVDVTVTTKILCYTPPYLHLHILCSKGTYIRSIAHDLGEILGCGAYLDELQRIRTGSFSLEECVDGSLLFNPTLDTSFLINQLKTC